MPNSANLTNTRLQPGEALDQFRRRIRRFTADDFTEKSEPYTLLFEMTEDNPVLYQQFSHELIQIAVHEKGANEDVVKKELHMMEHIEGRDKSTHVVLRKLHQAERVSVRRKKEGKSSIAVLPILCGIGKSFAVSLRIREVLLNKSLDGMLVVTDSTKRLNDYLHPDPEWAPDLAAFMEEHLHDVCIMEAANIGYARGEADHKKVLLMTTQRYMHLTDEELLQYTTWNDGENKRTLIIIDEEPMLYEMVEIGRKQLNTVLTALQDGIPARPDLAYDKSQCIIFWKRISSLLQEFIRYDETQYRGAKRIHEYRDHWLDLDDDGVNQFLERIHDFKHDINTYEGREGYEDIVAIIEAVVSMKDHGAMLSSRLDRENSKGAYTVLRNNTSRLMVDDAVVLILDGTAAVSPVYKYRQDILHMMDVKDCQRHLDQLHIHVYDTQTGVTMMRNLPQDELNLLIREIKTRINALPSMSERDKPVVFTYKAVEPPFKRAFGLNYVEHLGNIKGRNDFRYASRIAQVGLCHTEPARYVIYRLAFDEAFRDRIKPMLVEAQSKEIMQEVNDLSSKTNDILAHILLTDMEQNMFRGVIRNLNSVDFNYIAAFDGSKRYRLLRKLMDERYTSFGATVDNCEFSMEYALVHYIGQRGPNKHGNRIILAMVSFGDDHVYSRQELREAAGLSASQFKTTLHDTPLLRDLMEKSRISHGRYRNDQNDVLKDEYVKRSIRELQRLARIMSDFDGDTQHETGTNYNDDFEDDDE